jgi:murein DD-endopeptidase MepM/ murein hydrolase activator NlpD
MFASLPVPFAALAAAVAGRKARGLTGAGSPFGNRPDPLDPNGPPRFHAGTDIAVPTGTPLIAVDDGVVSEARMTESAGLIVRYNTRSGRVSCMHLSRLDVAANDTVRAGQVIGATGASGNVTGPHLHIEFKPKGASSAVDPLPFFPLGGAAAGGGAGLLVLALVGIAALS